MDKALLETLAELDSLLKYTRDELLSKKHKPDDVVLEALMNFVAGRMDSVPIYCIFEHLKDQSCDACEGKGMIPQTIDGITKLHQCDWCNGTGNRSGRKSRR